VLSALDSNVNQILQVALDHNVAASVMGRTSRDRFVINVNGERAVDRSVAEVEKAWRGVLPRLLEISSLVASEEK
jgi:hypothetical protein